MKRWLAAICAFLCGISLMGCSGTAEKETTSVTADSPVAGKKVAYIMQMAPSDIFQMWSESAQETAEGLGMEYDAFFCGGSDAQWQDTISQCAAAVIAAVYRKNQPPVFFEGRIVYDVLYFGICCKGCAICLRVLRGLWGLRDL